MKKLVLGLLVLVVGVGLASVMQKEAVAVDTGKPAPDFTLTDVDGTEVRLSDLKGKVVVLEWFNAECPFVKKHYKSGHMQALQKEFVDKDVVWLTINSTKKDHESYMDEAQTKNYAQENKVAASHFALDADGQVGRSYGAKTTPHMFIIDDSGSLVYQGAIDDTRDAFADPAKSKNYVELALNEVLSGKPVSVAETKPYGCSVKY